MMQKQLIRYCFMAFSGALLFANPIRAASDPCAEGSTCVWSLDDDGNLTIESGTYKDGAFGWGNYKSINVVGDNVSFGEWAFRNSNVSGAVTISGSGVSLSSYSFQYSSTGDVTISGNNVSTTGSFASSVNGNILVSGNNVSLNGSFGYYANYPSSSESITITGNNVTVGSNTFSGNQTGDVTISGNNAVLGYYSLGGLKADNVILSGDNITTGGSVFENLRSDNLIVSGNNITFGDSPYGSICRRCTVENVEILGDNIALGGAAFRDANIGNATLSGDSISTGERAFSDTTVGNVNVSGDDISFGRWNFQGVQAENIIFSGENTSMGPSPFGRDNSWTHNNAIGTIIVAEGSIPSIAWPGFDGTDDITLICAETEKETCANIKHYQTGNKPNVETYTYDPKTGLYNYKHKRYKDPTKIATGDYVPRRIYTIEEALEVVSDKGNSFMLRYK